MIEKLEKSIKDAKKSRVTWILMGAMYLANLIAVYYFMPGREPASGHEVMLSGFWLLSFSLNAVSFGINEVRLENHKNLLEICKKMQTNLISISTGDSQ